MEKPVMSSIEDCLRTILIEHLFVAVDKDHIPPTYSLRQDLGIDSLGFVELREQVEKRFSIVISDDEFTPENFSTICTLTSLINRCCTTNGVQQ
jgi:acyl carrier protein